MGAAMKGCDHDKVFSGQINLTQSFAWICRKCGEQGWSVDYLTEQVNLQEYHHLRVVHGWAIPRLPAPPRVPVEIGDKKPDVVVVVGSVFFALLSPLCALSGISWGELGPILPPWVSLMASGIALGNATALYVIWKKGSHG